MKSPKPIGPLTKTLFSLPLTLVVSLYTAQAQPATLDQSFDVGLGADASVYAVLVESSGSVLVGGDFVSIHETDVSGIARLTATGKVDTNFTSLNLTGTVYSIARLPKTGKLILGGEFEITEDEGIAANMARLQTNGRLDAAMTLMPDFTVYAVQTTPDDECFIGGDFTYIDKGENSSSRNFAARFTGNTLRSWNTGGQDEFDGPDSTVYAIAVQKDGHVLIGGDFGGITSGDNFVERNGIARLRDNNGKIDTTFNPGQGADGSVYCITLQPDQKILVGGSFIHFNGVPHSGLVRLNSNGSIDPQFKAQLDGYATVRAILIQPDGRILIGGGFSDVNGVPRNNLARLNSDGSLDTTFVTGPDFLDGEINALGLTSNGQIVIGGDFLTVDGYDRSSIARINGDQAPRIIVQPQSQSASEQAQVTFAVETTSSSSISYQWFKDGAALQDGSSIQGSSTARLTLQKLDLDDAAEYSVLVSNPVGSVMSHAATLTVASGQVTLQAGNYNPIAQNYKLEVKRSFNGPVALESSSDLSTWKPFVTVGATEKEIGVPVKAGSHQFIRVSKTTVGFQKPSIDAE